MYDIRLDGDTRAMLRRIRSFSEIDRRSINAALAESVRESTLERFRQGKGPDGRRWRTSIRAAQEGGQTLVKTAQLRTRPALPWEPTSNMPPHTNSGNQDGPSGRGGKRRSGSR